MAYVPDLSYGDLLHGLPRDQIHVWHMGSGEDVSCFIHRGRTRFGYDVCGDYVLKVGSKQSFAREVECAALLPEVAARVIGSGSTTLQLSLVGRPWEYRNHLVSYSIAEKLQTLVGMVAKTSSTMLGGFMPLQLSCNSAGISS